jgi:hypothetical protein
VRKYIDNPTYPKTNKALAQEFLLTVAELESYAKNPEIGQEEVADYAEKKL